ncbi:hypothetical protein [Phenylobacterium deserti]|uniref:DUF2188 domain-containing protein n=1 Tax=Phenylobacterium deserti TaxID=1914756 RepID=A0A328ADT1_9CAUL|nr:hypothetical protein [Phenylobacterium deserti]RAK52993.1 hypothetical protein DJ018_12520 [Phenylobacterium deserti]
MAQPVQLEIRVRNGAWILQRDGDDVRPYGHADEAVHDAVRLAHDLIHTGQPAEVRLEAAAGKLIEVDLAEPGRVAGADGGEERSAVVPDRSPSA